MNIPSDSGGSGLLIRDLRIAINGTKLVELSLAIAPGDIITVMGASGSGKSALLAYISGLLSPVFTASGEVWLGSRRIDGLPTHLRGTGLLFQDDLLFPHLSVAGNLKFALGADKADKAHRDALVEGLLATAGLAGFGDRDPATLSGGQRARVSLLRVLLSQPRALLLDEPFSKLDQELRGQFRQYVFNEARLRMLPVLMVTHDPADRDAAGGKVIELKSK
ncbi:MAG TPA: ATP-binding cassette domain-containing protein [Aestuariivirgaceae bacterium]|nr:ATP-binding cassette domain-containing protein [Aestuariivirgaceae bacterium]